MKGRGEIRENKERSGGREINKIGDEIFLKGNFYLYSSLIPCVHDHATSVYPHSFQPSDQIQQSAEPQPCSPHAPQALSKPNFFFFFNSAPPHLMIAPPTFHFIYFMHFIFVLHLIFAFFYFLNSLGLLFHILHIYFPPFIFIADLECD